MQLIPRCAPALPFGNARPVPVYIEEAAINTQRAIGTTLSHEARRPPLLTTRKPSQNCPALSVSSGQSCLMQLSSSRRACS